MQEPGVLYGTSLRLRSTRKGTVNSEEAKLDSVRLGLPPGSLDTSPLCMVFLAETQYGDNVSPPGGSLLKG